MFIFSKLFDIKNLSTISRCYRNNPLSLQSFVLTILSYTICNHTLVRFPSYWTFSLNECQSKSFEKMNTLLSAIFKFCTTKNLFKQIFINHQALVALRLKLMT